MIGIKHRYTGKVIATGEMVREAVEQNKANLSGAYLYGANLSGANLSGANLRGANLRGANLSGANLSGANLSRANLSRANLSYADLSRANLSRANLSYADLRDANLTNATIAWQSHDLLAEILRRAAGNDIEKQKAPGLLLINRDKCWADFLALNDPLTDWALDKLAKWVQPDDGAPECVRVRVKEAAKAEKQ